jgi:hypothetical protein
MKHILNNLSEQEKNAIREQHTGGIKLTNEKFSKLVNSKLGDSKPFLAEQQRPADAIEGGGMGVNEVLNLAYDFMNEHCPEGPKDKMKYQECIGRLHDIFGMVIRNLKSNIADTSGVRLESKTNFVSEQSQSGKFKVGQMLKAKRDKDGQMYTLEVAEVVPDGQHIAAKIKGPGKYEGKPLDGKFPWELNINREGLLMGNNEMGIFTIVQ